MNKHLDDILKAHQLRRTKAREELYSQLQRQKHPMSANEIFDRLPKSSRTDLVSIYRNLSLFEDLGLVHQLQNGKYTRCELNESCETENHIHIISCCRSCGSTNEVPSHSADICRMANQFTRLAKNHSSVSEILIKGLCTKCG